MQTETYHDPLTTDLAPPTQFDVRVQDILAPLQTALSQAALDRANAQAETRAWQEHARLQAEQITVLKEKLAAMRSSSVAPLERRADAANVDPPENGVSAYAPFGRAY